MSDGAPFNGDGFIDAEVRGLIQRFNIQTIIETGCLAGFTSLRFREMLPKDHSVISIDLKEHHPGQVKELHTQGVDLFIGESFEWLNALLNFYPHPMLVYLDAHGEGKSPLLDELAELAKNKLSLGTCVVCVHDFMVPGRGDLGFDLVDLGEEPKPELGMDLLRPYFNRIWPEGYAWHTNDQAEGDMRGIIYCYPLKP